MSHPTNSGIFLSSGTTWTPVTYQAPPHPLWDLALWWMLDVGVAVLIVAIIIGTYWMSRFCAQELKDRRGDANA